jgi:hypothetical protein
MEKSIADLPQELLWAVLEHISDSDIRHFPAAYKSYAIGAKALASRADNYESWTHASRLIRLESFPAETVGKFIIKAREIVFDAARVLIHDDVNNVFDTLNALLDSRQNTGELLYRYCCLG